MEELSIHDQLQLESPTRCGRWDIVLSTSIH